MKYDDIKKAVQVMLTPDLLKPYWRKVQAEKENKLIGHCYVAAEACYHILGGKGGSFNAYTLNNKTFPEGLKKGEVHWFLRKGEIILDPTKEQFNIPVPYNKARRQAFLTKKPSKRAATVIKKVNKGNSTNGFLIDWATYKAVKYACEHWHYSKSVPVGKLVKIGAWEDGHYIGCVLFGRGATSHLGKPYGLKQTECVELVRIALTTHKTPVSRIIRIALKFLKEANPNLRLIVSFADKEEGHHGGIYQATNWIYSGTSADCMFPIINGEKVHPRTLSIMVKSGKFKKRSDVPHVISKGKHRYLMPLDKKIRKQILPLSKPYPKKQAAEAGNGSDQEHSGGSTPTQSLQQAEVV